MNLQERNLLAVHEEMKHLSARLYTAMEQFAVVQNAIALCTERLGRLEQAQALQRASQAGHGSTTRGG